MASCIEPSGWSEFFKAIPEIVTAAAAVYGVLIAKAGLTTWRQETIGKRKAELAEEVLADFYQAHDIIDAARSPMGYSEEGNTRQKADWETTSDTNMLNSYFRTNERLANKSDFFSQFLARRYRFLALFGREAAAPYDELFKIRNEIIIAVRMLITSYRQRNLGSFSENIKRWEASIGWGLQEEDTISERLNDAVKAIERICRPAIQENSDKK